MLVARVTGNQTHSVVPPIWVVIVQVVTLNETNYVKTYNAMVLAEMIAAILAIVMAIAIRIKTIVVATAILVIAMIGKVTSEMILQALVMHAAPDSTVAVIALVAAAHAPAQNTLAAVAASEADAKQTQFQFKY